MSLPDQVKFKYSVGVSGVSTLARLCSFLGMTCITKSGICTLKLPFLSKHLSCEIQLHFFDHQVLLGRSRIEVRSGINLHGGFRWTNHSCM